MRGDGERVGVGDEEREEPERVGSAELASRREDGVRDGVLVRCDLSVLDGAAEWVGDGDTGTGRCR